LNSDEEKDRTLASSYEKRNNTTISKCLVKPFFLKDRIRGKLEGISKGLVVAQLYNHLLLGIQTIQTLVVVVGCNSPGDAVSLVCAKSFH
jgi:hypothetical protein